MDKKGTKQKRYSAEFKVSVIMDMQENHLEYCETVRRYWDWDVAVENEPNYIKQIQRWERIYLKEEAVGLMKERRGRAPELDKKVKEDLIAENQRLRMEIEYLKKLSALVLAEEQKNVKKQK